MIDAKAAGIVPDGRTDNSKTLARLLADAGDNVVVLPPGRVMTSGISLRGCCCSIVGSGPSTVIAALPGQTGPILDFTGYQSPEGFRDVRVFENFAIEGDGTPGSNKGGIRLGIAKDEIDPTTGVAGLTFKDISIKNTGGISLDLASTMCSHFERITLGHSISGDTPYIRGQGACNGNRFIGIGLRSYTVDPCVAPGGAAQFLGSRSGAIWCPAYNTFDSWWYEFQHLPSHSTLFTLEGNYNVIRDFQFFDVSIVPGATGTSVFRVLSPNPSNASLVREDYGCNEIRSFLHGGANDGQPQCGVEMHQRGNSVVGRKGKGGRNVVLMPQARFTSIDFMGSEQEPDPSSHGVVDENGKPTQLDGTTTIFDRPNGYYFLGGGPSGATLDLGNGRKWTPQGLFMDADSYWTPDGLYPGPNRGIKWKGSGTLIPGPNESFRFVGWEQDRKGDRRSGWVVPPLKGR